MALVEDQPPVTRPNVRAPLRLVIWLRYVNSFKFTKVQAFFCSAQLRNIWRQMHCIVGDSATPESGRFGARRIAAWRVQLIHALWPIELNGRRPRDFLWLA